MQIERLRLQNFRQYEDTEIAFGSGLTGIVGPNGAGKTTLLEAITWAMYGAPAARGNRDSIRRRGADPRAPVKVELEFRLGNRHFRIERTLSTAELYQDRDPSPIASSLQGVTGRVGRLLGMSQDEFFNTYFTGQKELAVMAAMKPTERAQFLSRVLGYEKLRAAQDRLRDERSTLRGRIQALESGLPDPTELDTAEHAAVSRIAAADQSHQMAHSGLVANARMRAEAEPQWIRQQQLQERVQVVEGDLRLADHKVQAARERFQGLDRRLVEANEARNRLEPLALRLVPLPALRVEREALDRLAEANAEFQARQGQLEELRRALGLVPARLAALPSAEQLQTARDQQRALAEQLAAASTLAEERRTSWVRDLQDAKSRRENLLDQYKELKEQHQRIEDAGAVGVCPTCARPLGEEFDSVLGLLERQLQEVLFNGQYFKKRIEQLEAEPADLTSAQDERARLERSAREAAAQTGRLEALAQQAPALQEEERKLRARIAELEPTASAQAGHYDPARHREVRMLVEELEPIALQAERLRAAAELGATLVKDAESAERDLSVLEAQVKSYQALLAELGYSEAAFIAAREAFQAVERDQRTAEMALARADIERKSAEETAKSVTARREERAERERAIARAQSELTLNVQLDEAFRDLRTDLNTQLRPDLSDLSSAFLARLTNGRYFIVDLDEDHVPVIVDDGEAKRVLSGGEEDVLNLAVRLAISQMIAERAGQPLSLLVLDEIFGSLDEERRTSVVDLLRSLADQFPQVILITHVESVNEGFDRILRVEVEPKTRIATIHEDTTLEIDGLAA
ncbi:MAG: SMC family ATPase [Gemmatimonadota bacterium]